jgi:hypothetical protein
MLRGNVEIAILYLMIRQQYISEMKANNCNSGMYETLFESDSEYGGIYHIRENLFRMSRWRELKLCYLSEMKLFKAFKEIYVFALLMFPMVFAIQRCGSGKLPEVENIPHKSG